MGMSVIFCCIGGHCLSKRSNPLLTPTPHLTEWHTFIRKDLVEKQPPQCPDSSGGSQRWCLFSESDSLPPQGFVCPVLTERAIVCPFLLWRMGSWFCMDVHRLLLVCARSTKYKWGVLPDRHRWQVIRLRYGFSVCPSPPQRYVCWSPSC